MRSPDKIGTGSTTFCDGRRETELNTTLFEAWNGMKGSFWGFSFGRATNNCGVQD